MCLLLRWSSLLTKDPHKNAASAFHCLKQLLYHNYIGKYKKIVFIGCSRVIEISCKVKEKSWKILDDFSLKMSLAQNVTQSNLEMLPWSIRM